MQSHGGIRLASGPPTAAAKPTGGRPITVGQRTLVGGRKGSRRAAPRLVGIISFSVLAMAGRCCGTIVHARGMRRCPADPSTHPLHPEPVYIVHCYVHGSVDRELMLWTPSRAQRDRDAPHLNHRSCRVISTSARIQQVACDIKNRQQKLPCEGGLEDRQLKHGAADALLVRPGPGVLLCP